MIRHMQNIIADVSMEEFVSEKISLSIGLAVVGQPFIYAILIDPGQLTTSVAKKDIQGKKMFLCAWWDIHDSLFFEILKSGETFTAQSHCVQLMKLNTDIEQKR